MFHPDHAFRARAFKHIAWMFLAGLALAGCDDDDDTTGSTQDSALARDGETGDGARPDAEPNDGNLSDARPDAESSDAAPVDAEPSDAALPCVNGEIREYTCLDMSSVPWCICEDAAWLCVTSPENACPEIPCSDGSTLSCLAPEPECPVDQVKSIQEGCWVCVDPLSCEPVLGCLSDADCPPSDLCDLCPMSVCTCRPHGCPTEPEAMCNAVRPDCAGGVAVVQDGCWSCVYLDSCTSQSQCASGGGACLSGVFVCPDGTAQSRAMCDGEGELCCVPNAPSQCASAGGDCLSGVEACPDGTSASRAMCDGMGELCCVPNVPSQCVSAGGDCLSGVEACPRGTSASRAMCDGEGELCCVPSPTDCALGGGRCQPGVFVCPEASAQVDSACSTREEICCQPVVQTQCAQAGGDCLRGTCPDGTYQSRASCDGGIGETCCIPARDDRCDDGSRPTCERLPPVCQEGELLAYQDFCYRCVNPATCLPWGTEGCARDFDCAFEQYCDSCGTASCPVCDDCVPACKPHRCATEGTPTCLSSRTTCDAGQTSIVRDGCWLCVELTTCEPPLTCAEQQGACTPAGRRCALNSTVSNGTGCEEGDHCCVPIHDTSCDDGSEPTCRIIPPVCAEGELLAYQNDCYACVDPATCRPR